MFIGLISDKHWERFCQLFERSDLFEDERLTTNNDRISERDWLLPELENMIGTLNKEEVISKCQKAGIPFAPIARPEDLFEDPQLNQEHGLLETVFPDGTQTKMPRTPIEYGSSNLSLHSNPPKEVGMHTREILGGLGYKEAEIDALKKNEIIHY